MDPTRTFCRSDVNITSENSKEVIDKLTPVLSLKGKIPLTFKRNYTSTKDKPKESSSDIDDVFLTLDITPFNNLEAYNLASIDMYFDITNSNSGFLAPQVLKFQNYVISGSRNYGFAEYIQYRNIISFIYFFEFVDPGKVIPTNINYGRLHQIKNYDDFRYSDYNFYINRVLRVDTSGVDVYIIQDYVSSIELLIQVNMMLILLKDQGDAIIKIKLNELTTDILTILNNCFDYIALFKPVCSNIYNDTFYLVCKFYKKDKSTEVNRFIKNIIKKEDYMSNIDGILEKKDEHVKEYTAGIVELLDNERYITKEITYVPNKIKTYLNIL